MQTSNCVFLMESRSSNWRKNFSGFLLYGSQAKHPSMAPNLFGEFDNAGGMISIDEDLLCSFHILKPSARTDCSTPSSIDRPLPGEGDHEQEASSSCCWCLSHVPKYHVSSPSSVSRSKKSQGRIIQNRTNYRRSLQHELDGVNNRKSGQPQ